jgi:hypothetical protein
MERSQVVPLPLSNYGLKRLMGWRSPFGVAPMSDSNLLSGNCLRSGVLQVMEMKQ